jgi:uncharacterized DUF497 family protein
MYIGYPLEVSSGIQDKIKDKHDISIIEVENSVRSRNAYYRKGRGKEIYEVLTKSDEGKFMLIVLCKLSGSHYKLLTARPMTDSEKRFYETKKH